MTTTTTTKHMGPSLFYIISDSVLRRTLVIGSCKEPDVEMLLLETVQDLSPIGYTETIGDSTLQNVKKELQNR
jgi:hypothetical protein